jgi:SpoVK/Ycf46/Vps4 family AAA+-type ATPase
MSVEKLIGKFRRKDPSAQPQTPSPEEIVKAPEIQDPVTVFPLPVEKVEEKPPEPSKVEVSPGKPFTYHQTKDIIEKARLGYAEEIGEEELPSISYTREKSSSNISFAIYRDTDMYSLLGKITKTVGDLEISSSFGSVSLQSKNGLWIWLNEPSTFRDGYVRFSKDKDLEVQEIEALIEAYKYTNQPTEKQEKKKDPKEILESLGAKVFDPQEAPDWDYIAGYEGVKEQVKETIILSLKHPEIYEQIARKTRKVYESNRPKAVLFEGPPGTGKTTTARIIAGQVDAPLVYVPIESIMSKWYGESENNLATIFHECGNLGSAILFLDEIDSLATTREGDIHEETRRVLSVLLRNIEGFNLDNETIIIGATNRKQDLDPALLSRFDTSIEFPLPDIKERQAIFGNYAAHLSDGDLSILARQTEGLSGRDIKNLCERVERSWASKLITEGSEVGDPPPLANYLPKSF